MLSKDTIFYAVLDPYFSGFLSDTCLILPVFIGQFTYLSEKYATYEAFEVK